MIGLVIDIETTGYFSIDPNTGTLPDYSELLEVGYIRCDTESKEIYKHGSLYFYKPYFQVESNAQRVHGLTRDFLEQYEKDFDINLVILNSLIQTTCIIGKNSEAFDIKFIKEFINKHSNGSLNIGNVVNKAKIRLPDRSTLYYDQDLYSLDLQVIFLDKYRELYLDKKGVKLDSRKKGTLEDYVNILDAREDVDKLYNSLSKDRVTGAHGALYDACMTYIVWKYCKDNGLY